LLLQQISLQIENADADDENDQSTLQEKKP
jgi:hypothetical protein